MIHCGSDFDDPGPGQRQLDPGTHLGRGHLGTVTLDPLHCVAPARQDRSGTIGKGVTAFRSQAGTPELSPPTRSVTVHRDVQWPIRYSRQKIGRYRNQLHARSSAPQHCPCQNCRAPATVGIVDILKLWMNVGRKHPATVFIFQWLKCGGHIKDMRLVDTRITVPGRANRGVRSPLGHPFPRVRWADHAHRSSCAGTYAYRPASDHDGWPA